MPNLIRTKKDTKNMLDMYKEEIAEKTGVSKDKVSYDTVVQYIVNGEDYLKRKTKNCRGWF